MRLVGVMPSVDRKGRVTWYYRRKGHPLVRLPDLLHDDPDFLAAYAAAQKAAKAPEPAAEGTIAAMVQAALASDLFKTKSDGYRAMLRRHGDAIRQEVGRGSIRSLRCEHIEKNVAEADSPADRLKAWRFICARAKGAKLIKTDPSDGAKAPVIEAGDGHEAWTPEDVDAYRARWPIGTAKRAAMELLFWTGARIGDACKIGQGMVDRDGVLNYKQGKTGFPAHTPWTCDLPEYADGMEADRDLMHQALQCLSGHMTFIATKAGGQRSEKALGTLIRESAREAGVEKSAHGLRKARAVALAEAGATTHQISAWTGHQTLKEVEHYTKAARRRRAVMRREGPRGSEWQRSRG